jgi:hypothetical protein
MKTILKYVVAIITSSFLLTGCCTSHHATQWEYKSAYPDNNGAIPRYKMIDPFLNDLAKDGWILVQEDHNGIFIFKRAKK